MIPRGRLDIGWADLVAAGLYCLRPGRREAMQRRVESLSVGKDGMVCLSVRSGFDLFLTVMDYPPGSEILVSAVTIRNMVHIIEEHGLVPVPVDVDMDGLSLDMESLEAAISTRSKAILVAHLFGDRMVMAPVARVARERGLLLIEDCAQSFTGDGYWGHGGSDLALTSFGPIKSATALGGAIVLVKDTELLRTMRAVQAGYPVQGRWWFLKRVARFALVRAILYPLPFSVLAWSCRLLGKSHDDVVSQSIRGFTGARFFWKIRHQPGYPLLALLARRIRAYGRDQISRRTEAAEAADRLMSDVRRPGRSAASHSHWVFPVLARDPDALAEHLWSRGFDATRGRWSLYVVQAPEHLAHLHATRANDVMSQVVYLPVYPAVGRRDLERLARAVAEFVGEKEELVQAGRE
jgi:perosamine synthetase